MLYYCVATLLSAITWFTYSSIHSDIKERTLSKAALVLAAFFPLFIVSAFRWNVGTDTWHTYTPEYLAMKSEYTLLTTEEEEIMMECMELNAYTDLGYSKEEKSYANSCSGSCHTVSFIKVNL